MNTLEISHIKKQYKDVKALDDVSFTVKQGQLFGLLGVNGAGKTTIVKLATGLIDYDSGEITFHASVFGGNNLFPYIPDETMVLIAFLGADTYLRPSIALKGNVSVSWSGSASDPFVVR